MLNLGNISAGKLPLFLLDQIIAQRSAPTGCPGGHPAGRRNRQPGVSARAKDKAKARAAAAQRAKTEAFWEREWRTGQTDERPPWLPAKAKRWAN